MDAAIWKVVATSKANWTEFLDRALATHYSTTQLGYLQSRTNPIGLRKAPWSELKNLPLPIHPNFTQKKGSQTAPCYATFGRAFLAETAFCLRLGITAHFPGVQAQPRDTPLTFGAVGKFFLAAHCASANLSINYPSISPRGGPNLTP